MERLKQLQLPIIAVLSLLLIWQMFKSADGDSQMLQASASKEQSIQKAGGVIAPNPKTQTNDSKALNETIPDLEELVKHSLLDDATIITETESNTDSKVVVPFEQQTKDYEWAYKTENAINDIFAIHQHLYGMSLEHIECRSSACQLRVVKDTKSDMKKDSLDNLYHVSLVQMALDDMGIEIAKGFKLGIQEEGDSLVFLLHDPKYR